MNRIPEHSRRAIAQPNENVPLLTSPPSRKLVPIAVESASGRFAYRPMYSVMMPLTSADLLITTPLMSVIAASGPKPQMAEG